MGTSSFAGTPVVTFPIIGSDVSQNPSVLIPYSSFQTVHDNETHFGFERTAVPTTKEYILRQAKGAETILSFQCSLDDTGTATTAITFDLLKNGSSILSAPVSFSHSDPDRTRKSGSLTSTSLADGDTLSAKITVTTSSGSPKGPYAQAPTYSAAAVS